MAGPTRKRLDLKKLLKLRPRDVIATREYQLVTKDGKKRKVVARFGRPLPLPDHRRDTTECYCVYQIDGLDELEPRVQFCPGVDGIQALYSAMYMSWVDLVTTDAYKEDRLSFWGIPDLGLPSSNFRAFAKAVWARTRQGPRRPRKPRAEKQ